MMFYLDEPGQGHFTTWIHVIACAIENKVTVYNLGLTEYTPFLAATAADVFARYPAHKSLIAPSAKRRAALARWARKLQRSAEKGRLARWQGKPIRVFRSSSETTIGKSDAEKEKMIVNMDSPEFRAQLHSASPLIVTGPLLRAQESIRKHYPQVRDFFRLADAYQTEIDAQISALRSQAEVLVGVHIRRTDYAKFMDGKYCYSLEQYGTCMEHVRALFPNKRVSFLVQSDEQFSADAFKPFTVGLARGIPWMHPYILAGCDYLIGPPSTFLSWASFYNQVPHYKIMDPNKIPTMQDFVVNRG